MTDREKLCREFTELTGGHWHESVASGKDITCICDDCGKVHGNPTYENPADVLRVMLDVLPRNKFIRFVDKYGKWWTQTEMTEHGKVDITYPYFSTQMIIEPDALLKAAVTFLEEREEK